MNIKVTGFFVKVCQVFGPWWIPSTLLNTTASEAAASASLDGECALDSLILWRPRAQAHFKCSTAHMASTSHFSTIPCECAHNIFLCSEVLSSMPTCSHIPKSKHRKIVFSQKGLKCIVWLFSWLYLCHGISFHNIDSGEGALRKPLRGCCCHESAPWAEEETSTVGRWWLRFCGTWHTGLATSLPEHLMEFM